ncbi:MAG: DUF1624 domain-containing protein [Clostridia bacterium]|nr:DUF1624 domain-containing protein [Clostridia bacterium]
MEPTCTKRYHILDFLRGLAVINMVIYHACYDLVMIFHVDWPFFYTQGAFYWQQMICISFICISGCVASFSNHLMKRGWIVFGAGMLMTVVTYFVIPSQIILFGVLSLLGSAMIITALIRPFLLKILPVIGLSGSILLFLLFRWVDMGKLSFFYLWEYELPVKLYQTHFLFFLGFPNKEFHSADYFPILPWVFLYLTGFYLAIMVRNYVERTKHDKLLSFRIRPINFLGRHTLLIYLIHQPAIYLLCNILQSHAILK